MGEKGSGIRGGWFLPWWHILLGEEEGGRCGIRRVWAGGDGGGNDGHRGAAEMA